MSVGPSLDLEPQVTSIQRAQQHKEIDSDALVDDQPWSPQA
jgi:hypothetical protein